MKAWWQRKKPGILAVIAYLITRFVGITMRLKVSGDAHFSGLNSGLIFCGWHGRSIIPANYFKGKSVWAIISLSRDGEMQDKIFKKYGFQTIRGSTGRGGARAAAEAVKVLRTGAWMAMTPDGPRGPSGKVQDGVLYFARKSGAALIPVGSCARPRTLVKSWDRYLVPWPFSKGVLLFGQPIFVPEDASDEAVEAIRGQLEQEIDRLESEAQAMLGFTPIQNPHDRSR